MLIISNGQKKDNEILLSDMVVMEEDILILVPEIKAEWQGAFYSYNYLCTQDNWKEKWYLHLENTFMNMK